MSRRRLAVAQQLRGAYGRGGLAPVADEIADLAEAYAVQDLNTAHWIGEGAQPTGYKIGMTSPAAQRMFGVNEPDSGVLFAHNRVTPWVAVARDQVLEPRIEGEIALVMGAEVAGPMAPEVLAGCISAVAPAIEIADSRIGHWAVTIRDSVADNASAGLYVLGKTQPYAGEDLAHVAMTMHCEDEEVARGTGAATMGGPLNALCWLARHLGERGRRLHAGDVVLTGALGAPLAPKPGARYRVAIERVGEVSVAFE